ncbi:phage tail tape measure protein [Streptomyces sp. NPDC003278]|uniref:phage tail tape measure protein n=1 Tax=Streptomyces sp. NPDC003278 TaxID=3364679 RepID=UPI0036C3E0B4
MALTVGELAATITVDDTEAEQGLDSFQQRLRSALSRATSLARSSGEDAGGALGDGLDQGAGAGADRAGESITGKFKGLALGAIGGSLGAALMGGLASAMEQEQITAKLGAQLGATATDAKRYGEVAGALYADAVTEDFQTAADTIRTVMGADLIPASATNAQIESIATKAQDLANVFEVDVSTAAQAAAGMVKNGLAKDATQAFDLLAKGMQGLGPAGEDLVETFREYSPVFKQAGISGSTAIGLMRQAIAGGWTQDTDKIADAFKEIQLRATEGSQGVTDALKGLGLNAKQVGDDIAAGGSKGEDAIGKVLDAMRDAGPESQKVKQAVSTLFGGPGEDLGAALFALDVDKAKGSMDGAAGAASKMGDQLRNNASTQVEQFKRHATQAFVELLGTKVVPILTNVGGYLQEHAGVAKILAVAVLGLGVAFGIAAVAIWAMNSAMLANPIFWVIAGIALAVVLIVAYWDQIKAWTLAAWDWVVAKVVWAKDWIVRAFMAWTLVPLIVSHWSQIKSTAVTWWNAILSWVSSIPGRMYNAFLNWTLLGLIIKHWSAIKSATVSKAGEMLAYVRSIPGRIRDAMGNLGSLLVSKGQDIVRGLYSGVVSMGGWLRSQLISFAKSMIPGPIAKALGIHSPSRVMRDQIGRWIPAGVVEGVEDGAPAVEATMRNLVTLPTGGQTTAATVAASTGAALTARSSTAPAGRITLDVTGTDPQMKALIRRMVRVDGRGSVQLAFGS